MRRGNVISWIIIASATVIALGAIAVANNRFYQEFLRMSEPIPLPRRSSTAWVEFDFGNGKTRVFAGTLGNERYNLSEALAATSREGDFTFRVQNGVLDSIGGVKGKWEIYRNGNRMDTPLSELTIRGGEHYTFRFVP